MRVTKLRQKEASGAFGQPIPIGTDAQYITVTTVEGDEEFTLDQVIINTNETINDLYSDIEAEIAAAITELNASITALSESTDASFAEVNANIIALSESTDASFSEVNASITALTDSTNESFTEVNANITALTNSTNESFSEVNASITALTNSTDEQFSDITSQIASINISITNIESGGSVTKLGTDTVGSTSLPIYLDAGSPKAITGAIATTYGGTGNTSGRATYINVTTTNPTSGTTYYIPFTTGISSGSNYAANGNNGLRYYCLEGTADAVGYGTIVLGNSTASGTAANKYGLVRIYGSDTNYWQISGNKSTDATNRTIYLPLSGGCMVVATNNTQIGSTTQPVYISSSGVATAMSGALSTTYGGTGNTSGRATYVNVTTTNPTSATTYYIPFTTGISSGTNYSLDGNNGLRYNTLEGTTSDVGYSVLYLGNATASGTAGNKNGRIRIYGSGENYWTVSGNKANTSNYTLYLPLSGGCLVAATNGSAVGGSTSPIYISSSGVATACNAMVPAAGTTMTGQLIGYASTNYTTAQFRNIILTTSLPSSADNGTVCLIYE